MSRFYLWWYLNVSEPLSADRTTDLTDIGLHWTFTQNQHQVRVVL